MSDSYGVGLACPHCGFADSMVKDTRGSKDSSYIRRRRECLQCHQRYGTIEQVRSEMSVPGVLRVDLFTRQQLKRAVKAFLAELERKTK